MKDAALLLTEIAAGSEAAFKTLFENYQDKLSRYLVRSIKSPEVAEEIVIDIFLKLWMGRELLGEIRNIDGFLYTVAHNKALDFLKSASRNANLQKLVLREMELSQENQADHQLLDHEYQGILHDAIKQLSPQRRQIFTLSRENGYSHDEIARRLNLSRNTVKNTITETLRLLKQHLKNKNIQFLFWF
jgi:RNA polymerase sigma-70 factor (family 1)